MSQRDELSDAQWAILEPWLAPHRSGKRGRCYPPPRPVVKGILWKRRTGARGQDIAER